MSDIALLISAVSLRDSLIEALKNANLSAPDVFASPEDLAASPAKVVVIDGPDFEKHGETLTKSVSACAEKPVVLLLGDKDSPASVSETFSKPFRLGHLLTRLRYYLETAPLLRDRDVSFGPYKLEPHYRRIWRDAEADPIRLTEKETALLVFLAQHSTPSTRADILAEVWGYDERIDTHTLETHLYQLRRKLDRDGENWIVNDAETYRLIGRPE